MAISAAGLARRQHLLAREPSPVTMFPQREKILTPIILAHSLSWAMKKWLLSEFPDLAIWGRSVHSNVETWGHLILVLASLLLVDETQLLWFSVLWSEPISVALWHGKEVPQSLINPVSSVIAPLENCVWVSLPELLTPPVTYGQGGQAWTISYPLFPQRTIQSKWIGCFGPDSCARNFLRE